MSLREQFENPEPGPIRSRVCSVRVLLETLPDEEAEILRMMLAADEWGGARIARSLKASGYKVQGEWVKQITVNRHRRGDCACDR